MGFGFFSKQLLQVLNKKSLVHPHFSHTQGKLAYSTFSPPPSWWDNILKFWFSFSLSLFGDSCSSLNLLNLDKWITIFGFSFSSSFSLGDVTASTNVGDACLLRGLSCNRIASNSSSSGVFLSSSRAIQIYK